MNHIKKIYFIWDGEWNLNRVILDIKESIEGEHKCVLCSVAYAGLFKKQEWKEFVSELRQDGFEVEALYINQLLTELKQVAAGSYPVVIGEVSNGKLVALLNKREIGECQGSVEKLKEQLMLAIKKCN